MVDDASSVCLVIPQCMRLSGTITGIVLLWLSKSAPKPRFFFSKTKPHWNRGFRLSIDSFGFSISNSPSSRVLTVPAARQALHRGATARLAALSCRYYTIKVQIAVGTIPCA